MEVIVLDDGIEYFIIDTIEIEGVFYTMFSNVNDETDFCFRKTIQKDGKSYYSGLENKNEFDKVLMCFGKKLINS